MQKKYSLENEAFHAVREQQDAIAEKLFSGDMLAAQLGDVETFLHTT